MGNIIAVIIVLVLFAALKKFLFAGKAVSALSGKPSVKIDFIFFNDDGLICFDGQVINCNIKVLGFSDKKIHRQSLSESYLQALKKISLQKEADWFFSHKDEFHALLLNEFEKLSGTIEVEKLEIMELSYADECFNNKEQVERFREAEKSRMKSEIEERERHLEKERLDAEKKLEEERDKALAEAELAKEKAIAKAQEELNLELEKLAVQENEALMAEEIAKAEAELARCKAEMEADLAKAEAEHLEEIRKIEENTVKEMEKELKNRKNPEL